VREIYEFIKVHQAEYGTEVLCSVLGKSRSAFYAWLKGDSHRFAAQKLAVKEEVKRVFELNKRRYGSRRIEAELKARGFKVGRHQIRNRMQEGGLKAIQPRSFVPKTTQNNPNLLRSPNLLLEIEEVVAPDTVWVGDITYLALADGSWAYLAVWMDLFSRMILGWKITDSLEAALVIETLKRAILWRDAKPDLVVHSDGGGQYKDKDFRRLLAKWKFAQSMTRVDNHYDNAFAESLFSRFKAELTEEMPFKSLQDANAKAFEYIETYYNRTRRHSSLGYVSPQTFEAEWRQRQNVKEPKQSDLLKVGFPQF
jgi:transposase InsO family protein